MFSMGFNADQVEYMRTGSLSKIQNLTIHNVSSSQWSMHSKNYK